MIIEENYTRKVLQLLEITSKYRHHSSNTAKEYLLLEGTNEFLEIGKEAFYIKKHTHKPYRVKMKEDNTGWTFEPIDEKYTLCYGLSLTNIVSLFHNVGCNVINISRCENARYTGNMEYVLTISKKNGTYEVLTYQEPNSLADFYFSDICTQLLKLYNLWEEPKL
jgi:hypothetical protein